MRPEHAKRPGNSAGNSIQHVSDMQKPPPARRVQPGLWEKNAGKRHSFPEIPARVSAAGRNCDANEDKSEDRMVNKVRVTIAGAPYAIATTDSESYITSLAKKLDEDITKLLDDNANLSVTKAAVFCAMDYLDEYRKSAGSAENMRSQIQDYIADAARAKISEDKTKTENETLKRENVALREQLARMKAKEAAKEMKEKAEESAKAADVPQEQEENESETAGENNVEN